MAGMNLHRPAERCHCLLVFLLADVDPAELEEGFNTIGLEFNRPAVTGFGLLQRVELICHA
jgi:hypothetical protein